MTNRIWIEIERPKTDAEGIERARLATALLAKLGIVRANAIWWNVNRRNYCYVTDDSGSYLELNDGGHWFNLDYLAK